LSLLLYGVGKKFLRGDQVSDKQGKAHLRTIYPGGYSGRSPHIHCKIRQYANGAKTSELPTQFFFGEQLTLRRNQQWQRHRHHRPGRWWHATDQLSTPHSAYIDVTRSW
jgi:protocatechuate 3,4-dioxygenase beta subunit